MIHRGFWKYDMRRGYKYNSYNNSQRKVGRYPHRPLSPAPLPTWEDVRGEIHSILFHSSWTVNDDYGEGRHNIVRKLALRIYRYGFHVYAELQDMAWNNDRMSDISSQLAIYFFIKKLFMSQGPLLEYDPYETYNIPKRDLETINVDVDDEEKKEEKNEEERDETLKPTFKTLGTLETIRLWRLLFL
jgi:hypothetical protein